MVGLIVLCVLLEAGVIFYAVRDEVRRRRAQRDEFERFMQALMK